MKICLYQEGLEYMKMITQSGITSAFNQIKEAIESAGMECTNNINDDFDILHINFGIGPTSMTYANYYKRKGKKVIIHAHMTADDFANSFIMSKQAAPVVKETLKLFYSQGDIIFCPSNYAKETLETYKMNRPILPMSNGVRTEFFQKDKIKGQLYREEENITRELVFSLGHVFKRKGVLDFCRIAETMPQFDFRWFGKIYDKLMVDNKEFDDYLNQPPFNLKFTGFVQDIIAAYSAGDMFFFPSYAENQGIAILEAASIGMPLILRNLPVYDEWFTHGENCMIGKNNEEFKELIAQVSEDKKLAHKLMGNGKALSEKHNLHNVGLRLKKTYEKLYNDELDDLIGDENFMKDNISL